MTSDRPRLRAILDVPVKVYLPIAAALFLLVWASTSFLTRHEEYPVQTPWVFRGAGFLEGWRRFDSGWYHEIATNGYYFNDVQTQSPVAFFPGYPLAMRAFGWIIGDVVLAGVVITFVSGLGIAILLHKWCTLKLGQSTARAALITLFVYPFAWFLFGAVHADAFFLVFVLAAFLLVERDHPVWAGLCAAVATSARPVGIGVVFGLIAVTLERRGVVRIPAFDRVRSHGWRPKRWPTATHIADSTSEGDYESGAPKRTFGMNIALSKLRGGDAGILLSATGLAAWCFFLWRTYGDPFLFARIEGAVGWDHTPGPRTWFKVTFMQHVHHLPEYVNNAVLHRANDVPHAWNQLAYTFSIMFQGLLVIGAFLLIPRVFRRLGWGYACYVIGVLIIPLIGSKDFQGTGRYVLAAFPVFAVIGEWLIKGETIKRVRVRRVIWAMSFLTLVFLTSAFARGYYLA